MLLTMAVESLSDLRSDVAEEEGLAHRLLALLRIGSGNHVPAVCRIESATTISTRANKCPQENAMIDLP